MGATVTILGQANCGACIFTKRAFELARISYVVINVDEDETAAATARRVASETGSTQLPVVVTEDGASWTGLRLDLIADLVRAA
jgi:glutaredoxin